MKRLKIIVLLLTLIGTYSCTDNKKEASSEKVSGEKVELQKEQQTKVLFVLTSHDELGDTGKKTGFWKEEFATPYYTLLDKGVAITIATPKGGKAPIDPRSDSPDAATEATKRFDKDAEAQERIANTKVLADMKPDNFDAVFYPGGHGPLWDLANNQTSIALIEKFNRQEKPVAFVCHAPGVLKNVTGTDGEPFVKDKKVTGFTNSEEEAVGLTDAVPFLVEKMLKDNGGIYSKKDNWTSYALKDGNLITGQNPASSKAVAELLLKTIDNNIE